jgi:hypothetical protein
MMMIVACVMGCMGTGEEDQTVHGTCPAGTDVPHLLAARCSASGCHSQVSPAASLDLMSPNVAARLMDHVGQCTGKLIDSTAPDQSLMIEKLSPRPSCGGSMPLTGAPLTADEQACVAQWVENVAAGR